LQRILLQGDLRMSSGKAKSIPTKKQKIDTTTFVQSSLKLVLAGGSPHTDDERNFHTAH